MEHIQLGLKRAPETQKAFDMLVDQLHRPGSPNYHKWLTPAEVGREFGPAQSDIAKLKTWLEAQGFRVNFVMQSGMVVDFTGDARTVREAFHTQMHNIQLHDGRKYVAAMQEPQMPAAFAELVGGFPSLNSIPPKPLAHSRGSIRFNPKTRGVLSATDNAGNTTVNPNPDFTFTCPAAICGSIRTFYSVAPSDFYVIYNENVLLSATTPINGTGQTIAALEESDINTADVTTFRTAFNVYPSTPLLTVQHGAGSITCSAPGKVNTSTDQEEWVADADVEWAGAVAPGATVLLESCQTTSTTQGVLLSAEAVIDNNLAVSTTLGYSLAEPVVSSNPKWGAQTMWTNLWQQAAAQGITAVVAAGDTGMAAEDENQNDEYLDSVYSYYGANVNALGATAYNVSVGGTDFQDTFNMDTSDPANAPSVFWNASNGSYGVSVKSYPPETTWNSTCASSILAAIYSDIGSLLPLYCGNSYSTAPGVTGGGGGPSANIAQPGWQSGVYGISQNNTSGKRGTPDVSMFAASGFWGHAVMFCDSDAWSGATNSSTPYPCTYTNATDASTNAAGGTAFAAAQVAGIMALVAQKTGQRQGQADYALYGMAANELGTSTYKTGCLGSGAMTNTGNTQTPIYFPPASTCVFNDVVTGNIDAPCQHSGTHALSTCYVSVGKVYGIVSTSSTVLSPVFPASLGWDFATGLGSLNVGNLVNGWIGGIYSASFTATVALSDAALSGASWTYGFPPASSTLVTTVTGNGSLPTGTVTDAVAPSVGTIGSGVFPATGCSTLSGTASGSGACQSSNTVTVSYTPTATLAGGAYTVTSTYSTVNENYTTGAKGTLGFTVTPQAMTYGDGSLTPNSLTFGAQPPVFLSQAVNWTGAGVAPASGNFYFTLNGVNYPGSCLLGTKSYTCTNNVSSQVISVLPAGTYPVTFNFTTDGNYATITGLAVGSLAVTPNTTFTAMTAVPSTIAPALSSTVSATVGDLGTGGTAQGTMTFTDTTNSAALGSCTLFNASCAISVAASVLANGGNTVKGVYVPSAPFNWATSSGTTTLTLGSAPATSVSLTPLATGNGGTGVTTATLTATITAASVDGAWGGTVTFTNTTTGATYSGAVTGAGATGTATVTISEPSAGIAAGLNNYTANFNGTLNYLASGASAAAQVYWQGLLVSSSLNHNFTGLISYGSGPITVEGTVDGTKLGPYGVTVYNFTPTAQTVGLNFTNSSSGAFSYATTCPASLTAGAVCNYFFYYNPPNGDGCNPTTNCTKDGANYPQGTYEAATWGITSGALLGVGDQGFDRSGVMSASMTLAGKAVLASSNPVSVSPLSYTFGPTAPGGLSSTLTITVTNSSAAAVGLAYTPPVTTPFQAADYCPANLAANSTCTINVTFQSWTVGTVTDQVVITPAGGAAITVTLSGIVSSNNGLQLSTTAHSFGNVTTGTSAAMFGLSVTNNASSAATLSFGTSQSGTTPYNVMSSGCPASLAAGAQCSVLVKFSPTAVGSFNDVLTVRSNMPITPNGTGSAGSYSDTVTFTGAGVVGGQLTATSVAHNWGNVTVGTTGTNYGVQLTNTTATPVTLNMGSGFTAGLYGFSEAGTNCGATLAVNGSCELIFSFSPTGAGMVSAGFGVTAVDASSNPVKLYSGGTAYSGITLSGTGQ